jgi:hypothetical protein
VAVSQRHESREAVGAAAAAEGRGGAGAERSSAALRSGGGIGRWRDEREANGSARDTMRAMAVHAIALVWRRERRRWRGEGGGFCWFWFAPG